MVTVYYLNHSQTYHIKRQLYAAGMKWDGERKLWWGTSHAQVMDAAERYIPGANSSYVMERELDELPKIKRGRPHGYSKRFSYASGEAQPSAQVAAQGDDNDDTQEDTQPMPQEVPSASQAQQLANLIQQLASGAVNEDRVKAIISESVGGELEQITDAMAKVWEALNNRPAQEIRVTLASAKEMTVTTFDGIAHKMLPVILKRIAAGFRNIFLVGPAGTGKTTLAADVAKALKLSLAGISWSAGASESNVVGRLVPIGEGGRFQYMPVPFVNLYENGGVFLSDEMDAADSNVLVKLNSALANGHMSLENRVDNPVANRHPDFIFIGAGNTYGLGANRVYVGRNQLDGATLNRFTAAVLEVDYDRDLEKSLVSGYLSESETNEWMAKFWSIREAITATGLRRIWGTRDAIGGAMLLRAGESMAYALDALTVGWTADERSKARVA